jgi:TetR/AcrR family transcriptional repressor of nem operon
MRKSKREAALTRQRIIKTAAVAFRKNGISGTGLSDLMAAAGLTHGGFYRHFDSKDQIVAEACVAAAESAIERMAVPATGHSQQRGLKPIVENYLSAAHRDDPAGGCPLAALGSEIARGDQGTRAAATHSLLELVDRQNSPGCCEAASIGCRGHYDRGGDLFPYCDGFRAISRDASRGEEAIGQFSITIGARARLPSPKHHLMEGQRR